METETTAMAEKEQVTDRGRGAGATATNAQLHLLGLSVAALIVASLLTLNERDQLCLPGLRSFPVPEVCTTKLLFHVRCPGCGLTRSLVAMGHLQLVEAWRFHHVGPLVYGLLLLQIPFRLWLMRKAPRGQPVTESRWTVPVVVVLVGLLIANWFYLLVSGQTMTRG